MKSRTSFIVLLTLALVIAIASNCSDGPTQPGPTDAQCGTIQGLACPAGQTCELPEGQCLVADLGGICVATPDACTQEFDPVCGCDGVTYGNDCERLRAGVQKNHDGECL